MKRPRIPGLDIACEQISTWIVNLTMGYANFAHNLCDKG